MNIAFTKIIRLAARLWEFNFRRLPGDHFNFHGDVTNEKGERLQFSLYKDAHDVWHVTGQKLPLWIADAEQVLGEAIEEGMAELAKS
ncbi:MAG TPA: hypothetical protein PK339_07695 [Flavitalea sp.]|nr:hypothetical protein [Flavitalea sp.]